MTKLIANHTQGQPGAPLLLTFHGRGGDEFQFHSLGQELRLPQQHAHLRDVLEAKYLEPIHD